MPFLTRTHALFDVIHVKKGTPASYLCFMFCVLCLFREGKGIFAR